MNNPQDGERHLDNDKAFAAYAMILLALVGTVLTTVVVTQFPTVPSFLGIAEHVMLGLLIRASYKSFAGWDWSDWSLGSERPIKVVPAELVVPRGTQAAS